MLLNLADGRGQLLQRQRAPLRVEPRDVRLLQDGLVPRAEQAGLDGIVDGGAKACDEKIVIQKVSGGHQTRERHGPIEEYAPQQLTLVPEVRVESPDADTRPGADLPDIRGVVAPLGEYRLRAVEQAGEAVRGIAATRSLPPFGTPL